MSQRGVEPDALLRGYDQHHGGRRQGQGGRPPQRPVGRTRLDLRLETPDHSIRHVNRWQRLAARLLDERFETKLAAGHSSIPICSQIFARRFRARCVWTLTIVWVQPVNWATCATLQPSR